ncbi:MAG TPA: trehalose-phosphatase [Terriglobales bacterium]|nr:trehalose-phosphatase [Terriglobales bacterium]
MEALERQSAYQAFLERLSFTAERVLMLDYDGTLAPFRADREGAFPYPEIPEHLARIMACGTRLVLISGRPARELMLLSGVHPHPEIWGSHGLERLSRDGTYQAATLPHEQVTGLQTAAERLKDALPENCIEKKPGGIAVHWRGFTPKDVEMIRAKVLEQWMPLLSEYPLNLQEFDGGLELRIPGINKGRAVKTILEESDAGAAFAYLGDDLTDEDAFLVLKGKGLTALVRPEYRSTNADIWLRPPEQLVQFLDEWVRACGGQA